ncbi:MAG: dinitrogenase iron-molybdenum cofactor biosynthesis protein [Desulfobacterales bacterium]|nr:dinitrogenase iron-molybdenum cofactor biosynthesis protein [Desulfobacterales bacterium]MBF0398596.1 dinitrogenase iron-molybdenum cofactor biosynthesis protein [Desulfobacterales bacterium]
MRKILVTLYDNYVAPRFDLTTEVFIMSIRNDSYPEDEKTLVLPQASVEKLCHLIITEGIETVICGGIEEEYYKYLKWKKVNIIDSVIGTLDTVIKKFMEKSLKEGDILINS